MSYIFNRIRSITVYKLTYSQQKRCCSGYGPLPNCPRKLLLIDLQNITIIIIIIIINIMVHQFSNLQFLMCYKYGMLSS